jgi:hypothetical protein
MLTPPKSIDDEDWVAGDARARWFYRCRDCEQVFTSLSEAVIAAFKQRHSWTCAMKRASRALAASS